MIKVNKLSILFILSLIILSAHFLVLADIAIPRAKSVQIQISQDYSDFDFYLCKVPISDHYDKGHHYTYHYNDLSFTPIQLNTNSPYLLSKENFYDGVYFAAVKKNTDVKENAELKTRLINLIQKGNGADIYFFPIDSTEDYSNEGEKARNVIYTIEQIGSSGIKTTRNFDDGLSFNGSKFIYIAVGLGLTGLIIAFGLGFIFVKKLNKKQ